MASKRNPIQLGRVEIVRPIWDLTSRLCRPEGQEHCRQVIRPGKYVIQQYFTLIYDLAFKINREFVLLTNRGEKTRQNSN